MSVAIAFEGCDGSGKTTLIGIVSAALRRRDIPVAVVGKKDTEETARITQLIQAPALRYDPAAEALLKLARERQRFTAAAQHPVTLLDRGLVSITSVLAAQHISLDPYVTQLQACMSSVDEYASVLCDVPFDLGWERMMERARSTGGALSRKELRGREFNQAVTAAIRRAFEHKEFTGEVCRVDTSSGPPEAAAASIVAFVELLLARRASTDQRIPAPVRAGR